VSDLRTGSERLRILVVDDERFFREAIRELLEADGVSVSTAQNASEALEAAADPRVGVVVLDIQLPDRSGLEVLRALRERRPEVRVVMLSAHTDQEYVLEALRLGACDYLAKPLHDEELRLSVRRALDAWALAADFGSLRGRLGVLAAEVEGLLAGHAGEDPAMLAAQLAEAASRLLDASKTSVLLREPAGDRLRVLAATGRKGPAGELDSVPIGEGVAGRAVAQGEPIFVTDVASDPRFEGRVSDRYESGSFVVMPLGLGRETFGALCATDRRGGASFREEDVALLRLLALALSPALDPAGVLEGNGEDDLGLGEEAGLVTTGGGDGGSEATPAGASDADLARAVCDAMTGEVEPERVLRSALAAVGERLAAAPVSVYLLDPDSGRLRREAQWTGEGVSDRDSLAHDAGVTGRAFAEGRPAFSDGPEHDPGFDDEADSPAGGRQGPLWVLPIRFRGRTLGVCRVFPARADTVSPQTAEVLATALSAAVRNVLLYRSLVDSIEDLTQARREQRGT
jgi:CheY-like chemotaxis protein